MQDATPPTSLWRWADCYWNITNHAHLPHFQSHRHGWVPAFKITKSAWICAQTQHFASGNRRIQPLIWKFYPSASLGNLLFAGRADVKMLQVLVLGGFSLVLLYHVGLGHVGRRASGLPPGPPTLPLIGNLHQLPNRHLYRQFSKWAQEYGPVYSLILGTKVFIIISSDQAVKDLLDQRGSIYSSRPENYIGEDVFSGGLRVVLIVWSRVSI